jgi:hypothetical protein
MNIELLRGEWIAKAEITTEGGESWALNYYIKNFECEDGEGQYFGLRVDKSTPEGVLIESEETMAITDSYEEALAMANAFAKGSVPPVTLLEMVDDYSPT